MTLPHLPRVSGTVSLPTPLHFSVLRHGVLAGLDSPNDAIVDLLIAGLAVRYGSPVFVIKGKLERGATVI